jgi:hypothetical protein
MSHVGRKAGPAVARATAACKAELGPVGTARRQAEIDRLPVVVWKGRTLYTLRCVGTSGKGPHDVNVPEGLCWALIGLDHFRCVYHAGDAWAEQ